MGVIDWFRRPTTSASNSPIGPASRPRTLSELPYDERESVEAALLDGLPPSQVAREFNVSAPTVYQLKRQLVNATPAPRGRVSNPGVQDARAEMERLRAEAELEAMREDLELRREERRLNIELKRQELEERRAELFGEDDITDDVLSDDFDVERAFLKVILNAVKSHQGAQPVGEFQQTLPPVQVPRQTPEQIIQSRGLDLTRDIDPMHFHDILEALTPEEIAQAKAVPRPMLENALKSRFPGITKNNIKAALDMLAAHG